MNFILLEAGAKAANQPNPLMSVIPFVGVIVIFYFLILRPQKQKQKKHEEMISNLQKHAKVITSSGIHGIITDVKKNTFIVKIDEKNNTRIEIQKSSVSGVVEDEKSKGKDATS